jgi:hypothetical protein
MLHLLRVSLITGAACALFTGCAGQSFSNPSTATAPGSSDVVARNVREQTVGPTVYAESRNAAGERVVAVFGKGGASYLRQIRNGGDVVADSSGYLYIAHKPVAVYSDAGKSRIQTFAVKAGPWNGIIAADGLGDFYVLGGPQHRALYEYQIGTTGSIREFNVPGQFFSVTTDSSGNLYLGTGRSVLVYAPGGTSPERTITKGINGPVALAVDSQGSLYVANDNFSNKHIHLDNITIYDPGASAPSRKITGYVTNPLVIHVDPSGNLGVLNGRANDPSTPPNITIYARGGSSPLKFVTQGINAPTSFAFDASNNLYVSNHGATYSDPGSITVYAAGSYSLTRTITKNIKQPTSVAVGP